MKSPKHEPKPGDIVVLTSLPPGLIDNLPAEDSRALSQAIGKPILLKEYDADGRAELEFTDSKGVIHFVYVSPSFIRAAK